MRYRMCQDETHLAFDEALDLLESSAEFCEFLSRTINESSYAALRWETPPVTRQTVGRQFEFVLVNDLLLVADPEPDVFSSYFRTLPREVLVVAVPNLGQTAKLVVPRECASQATYIHLKAFLGGAPRAQIHEFWRCVAQTTKQELSERRLWVSTAGGGVSWLHVRIEGKPKYYSYRPYANAA